VGATYRSDRSFGDDAGEAVRETAVGFADHPGGTRLAEEGEERLGEAGERIGDDDGALARRSGGDEQIRPSRAQVHERRP
jgi:hypothetical protein